jgi:hypothetical protein
MDAPQIIDNLLAIRPLLASERDPNAAKIKAPGRLPQGGVL